MSSNKTQPTTIPVRLFLNKVLNKQKREDCWKLYQLMEHLTGEKGVVWGSSIVEFGNYHYKYNSGREGDWFVVSFSPRKQALVLYLMCELFHKAFDFEKLGKHKKGKGCLYLNRLSEINFKELEKIIKTSISLTLKQNQ